MISCGENVIDSREARLMAVEPGVERPKLNVPSPVTYEVTSNATQIFDATAGEVTSVMPMAGALLAVIVFSPQVLSATVLTVMPCEEALFA